MKKIIRHPLTWLSLALLPLTACEVDQPFDLVSQKAETISSPVVQSRSNEIIPNSYIVQFKQDLPELQEANQPRTTRPQPAEENLRQAPSLGFKLAHRILGDVDLPTAKIEKVYNLPGSKGFVMKASGEEVAKLRKDARIAFIEPDRTIAMGLNPGSKDRLIPSDDGPALQALTYGVQRMGGTQDMSNSPYWAWIVDSGIDLDHEDLNVQTQYGKSFIFGKPSLDDEFGHGTHIAGIIGAKDNGIGVVGVAAGAPVVPIRVLDENGDGSISSLIMALGYLGRYTLPGDVINLSIGAEKSLALEMAVQSLNLYYGVSIFVAAGNSAENTQEYSPSALDVQKIHIVGSIDQNDDFSPFSNYGSNVKYVAPGENIYSTYKDNQYASISGTSMAAPHLAGLALIERKPSFSVVPDGTINLPDGTAATILRWDR